MFSNMFLVTKISIPTTHPAHDGLGACASWDNAGAAQPIPSEENHCHLLSEIVSKALNSPCGAIFWVRWHLPPTHGLQRA